MTETRQAQPDSRLAFFTGLLGYLEDKGWALAKVNASPHGSNLFELRVHHRLYLQSLLSAVDHVKDFLQAHPDALARFETALKNQNEYFDYVRELRNAVLHRGLDLVGSAHSDGATLWVICPRDVKNQRGTRRFQPPFKYFRELATYCEQICNPAIKDILVMLDLFKLECHVVGNDHLAAFVQNNPDIPEAIKPQVVASVLALGPEQLDKIALDRITRIQDSLRI